MNIDIESDDITAVITVCQSRLDASVAVSFRSEISRLVGSGHREVILDLQQVRFIDSSILGAMVYGYKQLNANGGSFVFCGVNGAVLDLLKLTRLDSVFPCYASVEQARCSNRAA